MIRAAILSLAILVAWAVDAEEPERIWIDLTKEVISSGDYGEGTWIDEILTRDTMWLDRVEPYEFELSYWNADPPDTNTGEFTQDVGLFVLNFRIMAVPHETFERLTVHVPPPWQATPRIIDVLDGETGMLRITLAAY